MAEKSGFFDATLNEETGEYDRVYMAEQFANYFKVLVGNGVFASPVNQLKVSPASGMNVKVSEGWGYINGYWYNNDDDFILPISPNAGNTARTDIVRLRWSLSTRSINIVCYPEDVPLARSGATYDLALATIYIPVGTVNITAANITDKRPDSSVCGFVTGLVNITDTGDLFNQYNQIFNDWFATVQDIISNTKINELSLKVPEIEDNVNDILNGTKAAAKANALSTARKINGVAFDGKSDITIRDETKLSKDYDFILCNKEVISFDSNNTCRINDNRITTDSLADVYFTSDTIGIAESALISVETYVGYVELVAERVPTGAIRATIHVRVV